MENDNPRLSHYNSLKTGEKWRNLEGDETPSA